MIFMGETRITAVKSKDVDEKSRINTDWFIKIDTYLNES